ncbi:MAG: hypothetical protein AAGD28_14325 [Bacteroidota bacterium]
MKNKTVKNETSLIDFSDSAKVIRETAKSINTQVREVVSEVAEDLKENGSKLADRTMAPVKEAYNKATEKVNLETFTNATARANDYTLKTAEEIIDGVFENGEKWQGVAEKAINGGFKLASKQQEMVFGAMETIKGQISKSSKRLKKTLYNNSAKAEAKK